MTLIKKPSELKDKVLIKMGIYGEPGIGKTTLALSSPNPLLFDFDNGIDRVEAKYQCDVVPIENYSQVLDVLNDEDISKYETLVFDTLGKCIDRICDYVGSLDLKNKQRDGSITLKAWGLVKLTFQQLIKKVECLNKNIIFVSHEKVERIDIGENKTLYKKSLDVSGSAGKDIVKELDILGYMQQIGQKRTISFNPDESFYAKNSIGLNGIIEVPDNKNKNVFFQEVILKHKQDANVKNSQSRKEYDNLIESLKSRVNNLETPGDCNLFLEEIINGSETKHIWNSLYIAKDMLNRRSKELNIIFNQEGKRFEKKEEKTIGEA
jgi:hypothetical protein